MFFYCFGCHRGLHILTHSVPTRLSSELFVLVDYFLVFFAFVTFGAARYTAGLRIVRHQYQLAASQRNEGRQCGALVAALFLLDLDDDFLAFFQLLAQIAVGFAFLEITAGDFLGRQKAVALGTVVDEAGFERRRPEERRVGKGCVSRCKSRWSRVS